MRNTREFKVFTRKAESTLSIYGEAKAIGLTPSSVENFINSFTKLNEEADEYVLIISRDEEIRTSLKNRFEEALSELKG